MPIYDVAAAANPLPDIMGNYLRGVQTRQQIDQALAAQQRDASLRTLMADPANFDPTSGQFNYQANLQRAAQIDPALYGEFEKQARGQKEAALTEQSNRIKLMTDAIQFKQRSAIALMANPSQDMAMQLITQHESMTGQDLSGEKEAVSNMTPDQIKRWAFGHAMDAKDAAKLMPQFKLESFGGFRQAVGVDPLTGQPITAGEQMQMTATPGERMTDARARAQQAEQRRQFGVREQRMRAEAGGAGAGAGAGQGKPPSGYRWSAAGDLEPIPGGPAEKPTKLPEAQQKQAVGVRNLNNAIANYRQKLSTFSKMDMLNPSERAKMGTAYNNMMLQAKEAFNLGVLNGPDFDILQSVIMDPRSISAAFVSKDALDEQASELSRIMGGVGAVAETQVGAKPRAPTRAPAQSFENMPNPAQYNGRIIRDDQSGTRWQSNGKQWVRVK